MSKEFGTFPMPTFKGHCDVQILENGSKYILIDGVKKEQDFKIAYYMLLGYIKNDGKKAYTNEDKSIKTQFSKGINRLFSNNDKFKGLTWELKSKIKGLNNSGTIVEFHLDENDRNIGYFYIDGKKVGEVRRDSEIVFFHYELYDEGKKRNFNLKYIVDNLNLQVCGTKVYYGEGSSDKTFYIDSVTKSKVEKMLSKDKSIEDDLKWIEENFANTLKISKSVTVEICARGIKEVVRYAKGILSVINTGTVGKLHSLEIQKRTKSKSQLASYNYRIDGIMVSLDEEILDTSKGDKLGRLISHEYGHRIDNLKTIENKEFRKTREELKKELVELESFKELQKGVYNRTGIYSGITYNEFRAYYATSAELLARAVDSHIASLLGYGTFESEALDAVNFKIGETSEIVTKYLGDYIIGGQKPLVKKEKEEKEPSPKIVLFGVYSV